MQPEEVHFFVLLQGISVEGGRRARRNPSAALGKPCEKPPDRKLRSLPPDRKPSERSAASTLRSERGLQAAALPCESKRISFRWVEPKDHAGAEL